jgi:hypothetical protein
MVVSLGGDTPAYCIVGFAALSMHPPELAKVEIRGRPRSEDGLVMAWSPVPPPADSKRKWFDLQTTRGWIETVGALVTVLGSAVGIYLQVFPKEEPAKKPETAGITFNAPVNMQGTGTNVVGSQNVMINITGYTIEQHEHRLRAREQELREAFQATLGQSEERRHTIEREL